MISIIVVGYNSINDLRGCFDSILKCTYKKYQIIFVDNDSSDDSIEFVKKKYPEVITIKNKNTGYAGGNNVGIKKAMELKSDFVFILNPDTIIDKNCLELLLEKSDQNTILQPLVLLNIDGKNTDLINTTGGCLNFLGFSYCSDYKKNKSNAIEKDIAIASGAAVFIPIKMLKTIELFDESFFMYHEDVDLFWRARLNGFNIRLIPDSVVWHKYSFSKNKKKMFYTERNRLLFLYKNFTLKYLILIFPVFLLNEVLMLFYSLFTGWFLLKIESYSSVVLLIKSEIPKRKKNLSYIRQSEKNLKQYIEPSVSFSEITNPFFLPYNLILRTYWGLIKNLI